MPPAVDQCGSARPVSSQQTPTNHLFFAAHFSQFCIFLAEERLFDVPATASYSICKTSQALNRKVMLTRESKTKPGGKGDIGLPPEKAMAKIRQRINWAVFQPGLRSRRCWLHRQCPSCKLTVNPCTSFCPKRPSRFRMTERAIGTIIITVAVLDIHIEKKAVVTMKPNTMVSRFAAEMQQEVKAQYACGGFHRCMASAMRTSDKLKIT